LLTSGMTPKEILTDHPFRGLRALAGREGRVWATRVSAAEDLYVTGHETPLRPLEAG